VRHCIALNVPESPVPALRLRELPTFRRLSDGSLAVLESVARERTFDAGDALFREGEVAHGIFVLLSGDVRVVRSSRGRRYVLHSERRGGTLGEAPVFDAGPYPASAIAATSVETLYVNRASLARALRLEPELALFFLARLGSRVRTLLDRVDRLATAHVSTRLAGYLLEQVERSSDRVVAITQEALAEELGTVREVVVRTLRELRERTVIRTASRGRIEVMDLDALRASAARQPDG
jgi:CRP/FNR family transcriptional regulator